MSVSKINPMKGLPCGEITAVLPIIRELLSEIFQKDDNSGMDECVEKFCETFHEVGIRL